MLFVTPQYVCWYSKGTHRGVTNSKGTYRGVTNLLGNLPWCYSNFMYRSVTKSKGTYCGVTISKDIYCGFPVVFPI
jgi:hypothetical protein